MSVHFISGKPGAGKSLYGVRLLMDELVHGNRVIVTNLPIKLDRLNEYFQEKYPAAFERRMFDACGNPRHISEVVIVFDETDLSHFFSIRANGVRVESISNDDWKRGVRPDYSVVKDGGIFYVLDEVHIGFNARAWAATGSEVIYYLSQHRKLGDDVLAITQHIGNVDKQFRSVAQDFTYIKNLAKQRAGFFRLPGIFTRNTYAQPATDTSKAQETGTFALDVSGLASCYDTAQGVGIHGRAGADTGARKKGLHWAWAVILITFIVYFWYNMAPNMLAHMFGSTPRKPAAVAAPVVPPPRPVAPVVVPPAPSPVLPAQSTRLDEKDAPAAVPAYIPAGEIEDVDPNVLCTGYVIFEGKPIVYFSDGTTAEGGEVQIIGKHEVKCFGRAFRIAARRAYQPEYVQSQPVVLVNSHSAAAGSDDTYRPVNDAIILPTIHSRSYGLPPSPRLNGIQQMGQFQNQNSAPPQKQ